MTKQFEFSEDSQKPQNIQSGKNFIKADLGSFEGIKNYTMENKDLDMKSPGKIFLHDLLNLTGAEASISVIPSGFEAPFKHAHHKNEELNIVIKGEGVMEVDGNDIPLKEGTVMNIKPEGVRAIKNTSQGDLIIMIIQTESNSLSGYTLTDAEI